MKRRILKLVLFLLLGAIINVAVAVAFGRYAEWPGMARMETKGRPLTDSELDRLWARFGAVHTTGAEPQYGSWTFRGWRIESTGCTAKGLGNNYVPPGEAVFRPRGRPALGGWRVDPGAVCVAIIDYGWPLRSVRGHDFAVNDPKAVLSPNPSVWHQNMEVLWPGFAFNTIFYAAMTWLLFAAPFAWRRRRRIKRGLCPACAYPMGTSDVCTECGKALAGSRLPPVSAASKMHSS